jgi:predicted enzyme related to lactoylglutathione lyase
MDTRSSSLRITVLFAFTLAFGFVFNTTSKGEDIPVFSKTVVDLGIVVSDLEESAKFYMDVIGLKEVKGFSVSGERAKSFGLTDNQPVNVRVFVLNGAKGSTQLKMMSFEKAPGKKADQKFIHSTLGFSYLTLMVSDMNAALNRIKKASVKLLGETPAKLGGKTRLTVIRDPDGNFIELIGPIKE